MARILLPDGMELACLLLAPLIFRFDSRFLMAVRRFARARARNNSAMTPTRQDPAFHR